MTRFSVRGGVRPRNLYDSFQKSKKKKISCPWCCRKLFKWISLAVWKCNKCGFSQTSGAFSYE